jgi:hypothetical protein
VDQTVLEEAESLVDEEPDQVLLAVDGGLGLENCILPTGQLSRRVNVVGLHVSCEVQLGASVKLHHGFGERVRILLEGWGTLKHSTVEGTVDLFQGLWPWEVYED